MYYSQCRHELNQLGKSWRTFSGRTHNRIQDFDRGSGMGSFWGFSRASLAKRSGICASGTPVLSWNGYPIEKDRAKLMKRLESELESVRYRMLASLYVGPS
jgi:hypothetical protein